MEYYKMYRYRFGNDFYPGSAREKNVSIATIPISRSSKSFTRSFRARNETLLVASNNNNNDYCMRARVIKFYHFSTAFSINVELTINIFVRPRYYYCCYVI